jgi:hypothetical protein
MTNEYEIIGDSTAIFICKRSGICLKLLIDTADLPKMDEFKSKWHAQWSEQSQCYYVYGNFIVNGKKTSISFHRWIMNAPKGIEVDHINNDGLDNRRSSNLRFANGSQNKQNRRGAQSNNCSSKIRGVSFTKSIRKWKVEIVVNRKRYMIGYYEDIQEAELIAKAARAKLMPYSKESKDPFLKNLYVPIFEPNGLNRRNKSGVKGVYYYEKYNKWRAQITVNGQKLYLGAFDTVNEAHCAIVNYKNNNIILEAK